MHAAVTRGAASQVMFAVHDAQGNAVASKTMIGDDTVNVATTREVQSVTVYVAWGYGGAPAH